MNTTVRIKQSQVYKDWHVIDAAGRPLGRVATEAAYLLKGKHKPTYEPHLDDGDFVIVVNASQVRVTGHKAEQITYYRHSGYPGGLKSRSYADQMEKFPERILEQAIWGMLPKGPLGKAMFKHLKVYRGANHPHQSQLAGSEKAKTAREAAAAELATAPLKVKRLRPLSVPVVEAEETEAPKAASAAATAARQARARVRQAAPAETEETAAVVEAVEAAPAVEEAAAEAPKRAPRRKAAAAEEATAEVAESNEEAPKPARRRAAAKSEGTEE
ncbi:MAG: 50S ribosomal protein L13 [Dehalococcoidia bacterium]|nr:50S ribosomal protein L13 [Dehalococcoidia bacterium]